MKKMRILFSIFMMIAFQANATVVTVGFINSEVCFGEATVFTDTSIITGGAQITSRNWDFGDGTTSTDQNPVHSYTAAGTFSVSLEIFTDLDGGPHTVNNVQVIVNPNPIANFSADTVCEGFVTTFMDLSSVASGSISNWQWDWGNNGTIDTTGNSSITNDFITAANSHPVGLLVTTAAGCQGSTAEDVILYPAPTVAFTVDSSTLCLGNFTELTGVSTVSGGWISDFDWELNGNGFFDDTTGQIISNQFVSTGNYQIGLQVTTDQGCKNDTFQLVTIAPYPDALFSFENACQNTLVEFTNVSLISGIADPVTYLWTFGNSGSGYSINKDTSFTFTSAGTDIDIELLVTNSFGCADSLTQTIDIFPTPLAHFSATDTCHGEATFFTNDTEPKTSTIDHYTWDFADGNVGAGENPFHQYNTAETFLVELIAYTTDGCRDTFSTEVFVWELPTPDITADGPIRFCEGKDVTLTVDPLGVTTLWSTTQQSQSITVDTTGVYEVLIVDNHGCKGEDDIFIRSWLLPELTISNDTTVSLGEDVPLWVDGASFYNWTADTYLDDASIQMPTSSPKESITYSVLGTDNNGCESTIEVSIEVLSDYNLKPVDLFTPNDDGFNERFYVGNIENYSDCLVKVYNRWGLEVYSSYAYQNDWTGDFNEDPLPDGTYYYVIECDGSEDRFDGAVTILR